MSAEIVQPPDWPRPKGYSNGMIAEGRILVLAGQSGWDPRTQQLVSQEFVEQVRRALLNIAMLLREAHAEVSDVVRLTWYITSREEYNENARDIGKVYREVFGDHYPAMSVVIVAGLLEPDACVEIEAMAVYGGGAK